MQTNNIPPQAPELESKILGAIMTDSEALDTVSPILMPEMFYVPKYQDLFRLMLNMQNAGEAIDLATVAEKIKANAGLKTQLTVSALATLSAESGFMPPVENYALIVKEKFIAREAHVLGMDIVAKSHSDGLDVAELVQIVNKHADHINELAAGNSAVVHIAESAKRSLREAEARQIKAQKGLSMGIPTGLRELDKLTHGWQPSKLYILAARPSMGKTAIMLHMARAAALSGSPGCIYSLEMSSTSLTDRMLMASCDANIDRFKSGDLTSTDWKELNKAEAELSKMPIYIDDNSTVSMRYIKSHATKMRRRGLCDWIMIDYLQLTDMRTGEKNRTREQEVSQASRMAKIIAKELKVAVILLSQLSRGVEGRTDKRPMLSDLRESGAIEQDADTVMFIHRPAYYNKEKYVPTKTYGDIPPGNFGSLHVDKQRDGATGTLLFLHNDSMTKIMDYDRMRHNQILGLIGSEVSHHYEVDNEPF